MSLTLDDLVAALNREGLPASHPVDVTKAECPAAGCTQAVVTDRFRLLNFATTGSAETYAAANGLRQVATIVVRFAPVVPADESDRYWAAIVGLVR